MHHKQQLERMQRLASSVLEEACVVFTLPNWQLLCDRRGLACGLQLANEHIVNKMGVKLDVVKMKYTKFLEKQDISDKSPSLTV